MSSNSKWDYMFGLYKMKGNKGLKFKVDQKLVDNLLANMGRTIFLMKRKSEKTKESQPDWCGWLPPEEQKQQRQPEPKPKQVIQEAQDLFNDDIPF